MQSTHDAIIIGTGQSGPSLAARMAEEGLKVAIIERYRFGGTCVNYGCVPTKALVASARVANFARRAEDFGINVGKIEVDMPAVKARMRALSAESRQSVEGSLRELSGAEVIEGHASFSGANTVRVGGRELSAPIIVINAGLRARVPDFPGNDLENVVTNSSLLASDDLPAQLVILGAGPVGLEFAQIYRRFGSEVTVVTHGAEILGREDGDIQAAVREILEAEGVEFRFNTSLLEVQRSYGELTISTDGYYGEEVLKATHLLVASGREPNTHDLGLEQAGVKLDSRGYIAVDDMLRTSAEGVYAIGDCNGQGAFTHTSYNDYEILAANLFDGASRSVAERIACHALYIDPPLGRIGMSEREARESGKRVLCAKLAMDKVNRAKEFGETAGFMKVLADADSGKILGASFLGLHADEAVQSLLPAMYFGTTVSELKYIMHIHPTVCELIPSLLAKLAPLQEQAA